MLRVVLDTNTIISGTFWSAAPSVVLDAGYDKRYILLSTEPLLAELHIVLSRKKFAKEFARQNSNVETIVTGFRAVSDLITPMDVPSNLVRDPKDVMVLACAVGGTADYIVSGDRDLLVLEQYQNIKILNATDFLNILAKEA